ncbi:hypothetical protein GIB67_004927 [Kingdonia uniflora]|uniref:Protein kinase domain-containing protein n=1 Tax=Kingdonia uniflora TaxID=39325 RepID=A0A7J7LAS3_9MAGN|nr:hypothetical protein GIB67_004927 [Kingdonia uniflora]
MPELEEWVLPFESSDTLHIMPRLRILRIDWAPKLKVLSTLGRLESLEELTLTSLYSLKRIGPKFFGISEDDDVMKGASGSSRGGESLPIIVFPKLKRLEFRNMYELEEWKMMMPSWREDVSFIMPCLKDLSLHTCKKLKVVPHNIFSYQTVGERIEGCPKLNKRLGMNQIIRRKEEGESAGNRKPPNRLWRSLKEFTSCGRENFREVHNYHVFYSVFDSCFSTDILEVGEFKSYMDGIVAQLQDYFQIRLSRFLTSERGERSEISDLLSEHEMTVMDYPTQYEGRRSTHQCKKINISCLIQGDVVLECIHLDDDLVHEEMMFRIMFNTTLIQSNVFMLGREEIDVLWDYKDQLPKEFKAEVLFSDFNAINEDEEEFFEVEEEFYELKMATNNFQDKLGSGGSASVFKGVLKDGTQVAVKSVLDMSLGEQMLKRFYDAEVSALANVKHAHLVILRGYCIHMIEWTGGPTGRYLSWKSRYRIAVDVAEALAYLHHDCIPQILHLDVKPGNILLDNNFRGVLSDFGFSRLMESDVGTVFSSMRGTHGYIDPEWKRGISVKCDIYSYGKRLVENEGVDEREAICLVYAALSCHQDKRELRPHDMREVIDILNQKIQKGTELSGCWNLEVLPK